MSSFWGCANVRGINILQKDLEIDLSTSATSVCAGSSVVLTASGADTYQWSNGMQGNSITVSPTQTSSFFVQGFNAGCSSAPKQIQINVLPMPVIQTSSNQTICAGATAVLTTSGADTYQWSNGMQGNSITVSPAQTTTYTVQGSNAGCASAPSQIQITVLPLPILQTSPNQPSCVGVPVVLTASGADTYQWSNGMQGSSITVYPTQTSIYSVQGFSSGCASNPALIHVTVFPTPVLQTSPDQIICEGESVTLNVSGGNNYSWSTGALGNSIEVAPSQTMVYTVQGYKFGCPSVIYQIQVTVLPVPSIQTSSDQAICEGETIALTATGADSYIWNNGMQGASIVVSPAATIDYSVVGTSLGCSSSPSAIHVTVSPIPSDSILLIGNDHLHAVEIGVTYHWFDCLNGLVFPDQNSADFWPAFSGSFGVIVSNGLCSDTSSCISVTLLDANDISGDKRIKVFPNPCTDWLFVELIEAGYFKASVLNSIGEEISSITINEKSNKLSIPTSSLPPGRYLLRISNKEHLYIVPFIKL
ncbi:MAG: T9SS type A sorting domain-containing protein [Lewinellaceae bacterium]|nr:T9SS type A sorting domain-containing protein [Lewinellaceae bacterium]